ncbi:MAG TPA: calcium-binding protein [Burkholderiaceae bacterium]
MGRPREQAEREHRIDGEVIVDAYDSTERAMSWYYYLEEKLRMPFAASCIARRQPSPLKIGERVEVVGMASEDECMSEVLVLVTRSKAKLAVPLGQLTCNSVDEQTCQAVEDWHYWLARGYAF